jgi:hypothetical protein
MMTQWQVETCRLLHLSEIYLSIFVVFDGTLFTHSFVYTIGWLCSKLNTIAELKNEIFNKEVEEWVVIYKVASW